MFCTQSSGVSLKNIIILCDKTSPRYYQQITNICKTTPHVWVVCDKGRDAGAFSIRKYRQSPCGLPPTTAGKTITRLVWG